MLTVLEIKVVAAVPTNAGTAIKLTPSVEYSHKNIVPAKPFTFTIPVDPKQTVPPPVIVPPLAAGLTAMVFTAVVAVEHVPLVTIALTYKKVPLTPVAV